MFCRALGTGAPHFRALCQRPTTTNNTKQEAQEQHDPRTHHAVRLYAVRFLSFRELSFVRGSPWARGVPVSIPGAALCPALPSRACAQSAGKEKRRPFAPVSRFLQTPLDVEGTPGAFPMDSMRGGPQGRNPTGEGVPQSSPRDCDGDHTPGQDRTGNLQRVRLCFIATRPQVLECRTKRLITWNN